MKATAKERIRELLLRQRTEIEREMVAHGGRRAADSAAELRDPEERAAALGEEMVDDRIASRDGDLLEKIDLALRRLEEGTYEHCASCGEQIPMERLLAKPSVSLCVRCQAAKEPR